MTGQAQVLGRAQITINGAFYDSLPGAELTVGGVKNNERMTNNNFQYNQTLIPSGLTASFAVKQGVSIVTFQGLADATINFAADTGQTWVITNAAQTGTVKLKDGADGGFVECTFSGSPAEEMLS